MQLRVAHFGRYFWLTLYHLYFPGNIHKLFELPKYQDLLYLMRKTTNHKDDHGLKLG